MGDKVPIEAYSEMCRSLDRANVEIKRLKKEVEILNDHYNEADKAKKVALGEQGMEYEKEIKRKNDALTFIEMWATFDNSDSITETEAIFSKIRCCANQALKEK